MKGELWHILKTKLISRQLINLHGWIIFTLSHSWVLKRGMNIIKQFLTRHIFFKLFSLNCFWRVRNIYVPSWFSSSETVCFWASEIFKFIQLACDASENYQIYSLQTASGVRNIHVLNLFSCFWHVRNFSNVFSSTCFWRVRNIDVSNLSSLSETVCFWASEICSNLRSSNCFWSVRNFSTLFFRQPVSFKFIFLFLTRRNFF